MCGHLGEAKTSELLRRYYWWKSCYKDVLSYVRQCHTCQASKHSTQQPAGKLQPLPIDNRPWETITMDFIEELPETKNKHKGILTVVDKFSKLCHFIALPDCVDAV